MINLLWKSNFLKKYNKDKLSSGFITAIFIYIYILYIYVLNSKFKLANGSLSYLSTSF